MTTINAIEKSTEASSAWFIQGCLVPDGPLQRISVPAGRFQIGRRPDLNLSIAHGSVSKLHAEFIATDAAIFVRDLGSTNGTYVNGARITEDTPIGEHDVVRFADFEFIVGQIQADSALRTMVSLPSEWQLTFTQFHRLIAERSVVPYFQPIVQLPDGQAIGYELLARSNVKGLASPREMFETAERIGLAAKLSVLCRENGVESAQKYAKPGLLFVNTHPTEKPHAGLLESLAHLRSLAPDLSIVLELHEAAITDALEIRSFRDELKQLQIQLAFDDFGAGQARLMELSEVAPDYLKFDIGLIRDIHLAPQRQQMVAGLVRIVRELGIQPLAEGIEIAAEAEVCCQIGFTHAQGYYYGKPAPALIEG